MPKFLHLTALTAVLLSSSAVYAQADMVFKRVASFDVSANIPTKLDKNSESSSEIITASEDGMSLLYSDSPLGGIGMIDISDPASPQPAGFIALDGEPTSVSVIGGKALVGVNTSESYTAPSGKLAIIDIASKTVEASCDLDGQPDSVAVAKDGSMVAIAIENERDEDLNDGVIPQMPAGNVTIFDVKDGTALCDTKRIADVTGLAEVAPSDPEPEFVDFNDAGEIVVSMQENNHMAVINGTTGEVISHFSAGAVDLKNVDLDEEAALTFDGEQLGRVREPDAVKWLDNDRFVTANEGDYEGGSRGFTIFNKDGTELFESGLSFEYKVAMAGHYPEKRSGNKGAEPEGLEVATFGDTTYIFVLSERGSVVGVYKDTGAEPEFVQLLPTGLGPEGAVGISERGIFAVANEVDLIEDGGVRSHVTIYTMEEGEAQYPMLSSVLDDADRPIGWGALSGLVADDEKPGILYAVNDSFYALQPSIFTIDANQTPAKITAVTRVTRGKDRAAPAQMLDLEGITTDGEGGFWLASEGRTGRMIPHGIYNVNDKGVIKKSIAFPAELLAVEKRFGSEGITKVGDTLWIAIQREWNDDEKGFVKLVSYNLETEEWGAVHYPTDIAEASQGWVGLSEITANGDFVYIVERDNQIGANAKIKRLYKVALSEMQPAKLGGELPVVSKELVRDFIPDMQATGGYVVDKIEGFAIDASGNGFAVTDNDGVDDSNGETLFFGIGAMN